MRKKTLATVYAVLCTLLLVAGFVLCFVFALQKDTDSVIEAVVGMAIGLCLAPVIHETGHIVFAKSVKMQIVYAKFFCFKLISKKNKLVLRFASPFAPDETQTVPKTGGNMKKRAGVYALGGLIFSGVFLILTLVMAIILTCIGHTNFLLWGLIPYMGYLFLLNALPLEYASGKTDAAVYLGIQKGCDAERVMLAAMEIQGQLYDGKTFAEIDEGYYFDIPQLAEDEPLFAVVLDLRYRYYLEKEDYENAASMLNRLAGIQEYLSQEQTQTVMAELVYLHSLNGDFERAEACANCDKEYFKSDKACVKRALAAYCAAFGKTEAVLPLKKQAEEALRFECMYGVKKWECILLARITNNNDSISKGT